MQIRKLPAVIGETGLGSAKSWKSWKAGLLDTRSAYQSWNVRPVRPATWRTHDYSNLPASNLENSQRLSAVFRRFRETAVPQSLKTRKLEEKNGHLKLLHHELVIIIVLLRNSNAIIRNMARNRPSFDRY